VKGAFLAVDWGTTNRRTYRIGADGTVEKTARDDRGVLAMPPGGYEAEAGQLREAFGDLPMLCAGMVGSNRGWAEAPYVPCPAALGDIAREAVWVEPGRTAILPGVSRPGERSDTMRGEEVQLLGAAASGAVPDGALLCQPGTHCKWARVEDGRLAGFVTAMTGEMFALLKEHSLLSAQLNGAVEAGRAFREGVADSGGDLLARLFGVRAAGLLGQRADADAASYTSGLMIGSDVRARLTESGGAEVFVLADAELGALYRTAIAALGGKASLVDSQAAFAAGATAIWNELA